MRKLYGLFVGFFSWMLFSLGAVGFLSYVYVDNPAPTKVAEIVLHDCGTSGCGDIGVALVNVDVKNPHRARDSILT